MSDPTRVYISGPMRGYDGSNFPAFFEAEKVVRDLYPEAEVFNPAAEDVRVFGLGDYMVGDPSGLAAGRSLAGGSFTHTDLQDALTRDLTYICQGCDLLVMLPGWGRSKGAVAEWSTAQALGIGVVSYGALTGALEASKAEVAPTPAEPENACERPVSAPAESVSERILAADTPDQMPGYGDEVRMTSPTGGEKGAKLASFSQISPYILREVAEHYGMGARKYAAHNFRRGYPWSLTIDAMWRHYTDWQGGKEYDDCPADCATHTGEMRDGRRICTNHTGSRHLIAFLWHAFALAEFTRFDTYKEYDDRYVHTN